MTVRYGLIGSGMMGQEHIRNIHLLDDAVVTAIADPDEGMRNRAVATSKGSAHAFSDHKALLSADICDAYIIAAPNDLHHALLKDILQTNKPILCEKPLCATSDHCRDVITWAQRRSAPVWVAMEYRYMPPLQRLLEERDKGTIGAPVMMAIREHRFPFLVKVGDWNRFNARTGGTLVEKCCHFWDLMRLMLRSNPVRLYASGGVDVNHLDERYDGKTPDIIDNAFVVVDFANGTRGLLDLCMFAEGSKWQEVVSLTGVKARVDACVPGPARFSPDGEERPAQIEIHDRETRQATVEPIHVDRMVLTAGDHHGSTYFQHVNFFKMIKSGNGVPEVSLHDGLWSVSMGEAAERSIKSGEAITL